MSQGISLSFSHDKQVLEEPKTYDDAADTCEKFDGFLVIIHDFEEQRFIFRNLSPRADSFWMGLRRLLKFDPFEWADGSPVKYTSWDKGEPFKVCVC